MKSGNKGVIHLKEGSRIYTFTDQNKYKHVEGKSIDKVMFDETNG